MLYRFDRPIGASKPVKVATLSDFGFKEKDLEVFLGSHLTAVVSEEHLMLIGQERPWQEEADLLALDRKGVLYIFELKRWESRKENILQVLRYGQIFGRYSYGDLERLAQRHRKLDGGLAQAHMVSFELDAPLPESAFNHDQVFVLVTNGVDEESISVVNYWSKKGLKIVVAPYRVYRIGNEPYIQFQPYNPDGDVIVERESTYFIVNTNRTYAPDVWKDMIGDGTTGKASAYYGRKNTITKIPKKATVFLYHTGVGVIAKGRSTSTCVKGDVRIRDVYDEGEEFFVPLKFDWALSQDDWTRAPRASQINKSLGTSYRFRHTVFAIGENMARAIDSIAVDRGVPGAKAAE